MSNYPLIRKMYLYLFSLVGLVLIVIGCVRLVGLGLRVYIFTKADVYPEYPAARPIKTPDGAGTEFEQPSKEEIEKYQQEQKTSNRQKTAAESLAMIIVGAPLYWYHWRVIKREKDIGVNN